MSYANRLNVCAPRYPVLRFRVSKRSKHRREFGFNEDNMIDWSKVFQGGCNLRWKESHESAPTRSR